MAEPLQTYRDSITQIVPRWLRGRNAGRILYTLGLQLDVLADATVQAIRRRFPNVDSDDSITQIGKDRKIARGPTEDAATYAARIGSWLDQHRIRGGPYALLQQLGAYWGPSVGAIGVAYENGKRYVRDTAGNITQSYGAQFDGDSTHWARWWVLLQWLSGATADGLWSDLGVWDDGGVWDSSLTPAQVADVRLVPAQWGNAHSFGNILLLSDGGETWDWPAGLWSDTGTWDQGAIIRLSADG